MGTLGMEPCSRQSIHCLDTWLLACLLLVIAAAATEFEATWLMRDESEAGPPMAWQAGGAAASNSAALQARGERKFSRHARNDGG